MNMQLRLWSAAFVLLVLYAWTAVVSYPGGDDYSLVLKPAPSIFHSVEHLEVRDWNRRLSTGKLPRWLATGSYVTLARGSDESGVPGWIWLYRLFALATFSALAAALAASARAALRVARTSRGGRS